MLEIRFCVFPKKLDLGDTSGELLEMLLGEEKKGMVEEMEDAFTNQEGILDVISVHIYFEILDLRKRNYRSHTHIDLTGR